MNSCIYTGTVQHRRFTPVEHQFVYPMFMPFIDLDELDSLAKAVPGFGFGRWHPARFRRADYVGQAGDLRQAVRDKVEALTGERIEGRVMLLCQLRYFGIYFSPLNLYYVYDSQDRWRYLLAEVSNTPWNQRHYYAVPAPAVRDGKGWHHPKAFHVSPFNPMEQHYLWRVAEPDSKLNVHIESRRQHHDGERVFDAGMTLNQRPFDGVELRKMMIKMPILTLSLQLGIYWQALKLWIKGAPYYQHPGQLDDSKHHRSADG